MYGRLICDSVELDSSILVFSAVSRSRYAVAVLEVLDQPVHDALVPVVTAEVVVAAGRLDLDHALADFEQRDVECAAAQVEDEDRRLGRLV